MVTSLSGSEKKAYSLPCDVLYFDAGYKAGFGHLAKNSIISSRFNFFEGELNPNVLGLKYVTQGLETYLLKGKRYRIPAGKYLLVNQTAKKMEVAIKDTETRSLCVNIEPKLLNDILAQLTRPDNLEAHQQVSDHLQTPELFVRETSASPTFQAYLSRLYRYAASPEQSTPAAEQLFELTALLVEENLEVISAYHKLRTAKLSTRQELFHRLLQGKEMLDDSVFSDVSIGQVAGNCCLSEYRFYRLFRQCFGLSPYHYLFRRRIEKGLELKKQNLSWSEIAFRLNFTDLAAFSNGFKKVTGVAPSKFALETA